MTELQPFDDERLSAYLDDQLSRAEREQFEQLIQERADYRQALDELRTLRARLRSLPAKSLGHDFSDRVLRKAETATLVGDRVTAADRSVVTPNSTQETGWTRKQWLALASTIAAGILAIMLWPDLASKEPAIAEMPVESASAERSSSAVHDQPALDDDAAAGIEMDALEESDTSTSQPDLTASPIMADPEFDERGAGSGFGGPDPNLRFASIEDPEFQQLAEEAQQILQQLEPDAMESTDWDLVVATELRDENDWNGLRTALDANQMSLVEAAASSLAMRRVARDSIDDESEMLRADVRSEFGDEEYGSIQIQQDATLFNQKLNTPVADAKRQRSSSEMAAKSSQLATAGETHLLYVEGTEAQLNRLMETLATTQSSQIMNVVQKQLSHPAKPAAVKNEGYSGEQFKKRGQKSGRAIHLGQSTLNRSAEPQVQLQKAQEWAIPQQQLRQRAQSKSGGSGDRLLRGLIILQDVSE